MRILNKYIILLFIIILNAKALLAQVYIPADPYDLLFTEQKIMVGGKDPGSLIIRPFAIPQGDRNIWSLKVRSELFYNDGAPNLENTSNKWVSKGISFFTSANIAFNSKYIFASTEPFIFTTQNKKYNEPVRIPKFMHLNDNLAHTESPYRSIGLRETQLYLKYKDFGVGWSNANMWWGPGLHSSLMMSNNTTGFGHLMIGTVSEKRYKDWGFNGRYVFSKFGERSKTKPYYSGIVFNSTYYSNPIIAFGLARSFLSGGSNSNYDFGTIEAALLPFQIVTVEKSDKDILNPLDQRYVGYINLKFPESGLVMYLEYGRTMGPENFKDFVLHPDHSSASIFGIRKHGVFGNINLVFGLEYVNLTQSPFWSLRETVDWNSATNFDFNTYDGRYWGAHSGPDSDDFTIYLTYNNKGLSITPSINYERHNVTHPNSLVYQNANTIVFDNILGYYYIEENRNVLYDMSHLAEAKVEFRFDIRYLYNGYKFSVNYEFETLYNEAFLHSSSRSKVQTKHSNVFWIGIEKHFDGTFPKYFDNILSELKL